MEVKKIAIQGFLISCVIAMTMTGCSLSQNSKQIEAYRKEGIEQLESGKYKKAISVFQQGVDASDSEMSDLKEDIYYYLALAQYKNGQWKDAVQTYNMLIEKGSAPWKAYYLRGCLYLKNNQEASALQDFDQAISKNTNDYELYINIYFNLRACGNLNKAKEYAQKGLLTKSNEKDADSYLGYLKYLTGDTKGAKIELKAAAKKSELAYLYLGIIEARANQLQNAKKRFLHYAETYSDNGDKLLIVARSAVKVKLYEEGIHYYQSAIKLFDSESKKKELQREVIAVYESKGDYVMALKGAEDFLKQYPNDSAMKRELVFLKTR